MSFAGIDESSWQAKTWTAAALHAQRIAFVSVKATEITPDGSRYVNPDWEWQVAAARGAGCAVMHYHMTNYSPVNAEVSFFHDTIAPRLEAGDMVMLDNEADRIERMTPADASRWTLAFSAGIKHATGARACVQYTSDDPIRGGWLEGVRGSEPLFLAWPGADPAAPPSPARAWLLSFLQYGSRATPGGGSTDADAAYFSSLARLMLLGIPASPAPDWAQQLAATLKPVVTTVNSAIAALEQR